VAEDWVFIAQPLALTRQFSTSILITLILKLFTHTFHLHLVVASALNSHWRDIRLRIIVKARVAQNLDDFADVAPLLRRV
jgi:hypothetical protein